MSELGRFQTSRCVRLRKTDMRRLQRHVHLVPNHDLVSRGEAQKNKSLASNDKTSAHCPVMAGGDEQLDRKPTDLALRKLKRDR
jgi:hypothetical protein